MQHIVLNCPNCSTKNRVPAGRVDVICGKCKSPLYDFERLKAGSQGNRGNNIRLAIRHRLSFFLVIVAILYALATCNFELPSPADPLVAYSDQQKTEISRMLDNTSTWEKQLLQSGLKVKGYYEGPLDGIIGPQTKAALHSAGEKYNYSPGNLINRVTRWERNPGDLFRHLYQPKITDTQELWFLGRARRVAPFEVKTDKGAHYYLKLREANTKADLLGVFITGGQVFNTKVPLGNYELVYASGETWYGEADELYFGPTTQFSKANTVLEFKRTGQRISGHTISLVKVVDGNLSTTTINAKDF